MTGATDPVVLHEGELHEQSADGWLHDKRWDQIFVVGGALLVPVPIVLFYALKSAGFAIGTCEDLVTIVVMVLVGGPHVFATYTRTFLNPTFRTEDKRLFYGAFAVVGLVIAAVVSSAFLDVRFLGRPPIQFVLTFFFFWAGIHVLHQNSYCAACYEVQRPGHKDARRRAWNVVDYFAMFGCLFPAAFFRMSMVHPTDLSGKLANPDALATHIVAGLTGSAQTADEYVFRIGRVTPVLPDFVMADAFWLAVTGLYLIVIGLFVCKSVHEWRAGTMNWPRFQLVALTIVIGFAVPLFPNLDTSFQGMNTWHSFQYLGLVWLMNRRAESSGQMKSRLVRKFSGPGQHWRFYSVALAATLLLIGLVFAVALAIQYGSRGEFLLFGPPDGAAAAPSDGTSVVYRPGSLLLAYYMIAFSLLLVHYLHDGFFFFRTRYLVDRPGS